MGYCRDFTIAVGAPTNLPRFFMIPGLRLTATNSMMIPDEFNNVREIRIMITLATAFLIISFALLLAIGLDTTQHTDTRTY